MRTLRFVAPSVVAACAAALLAGVVLGRQDRAYAIAVATGFGAIVIAPATLAASLALRGIARAWRPRELIARLTDPDGRAPRLAAWATVVWLGIAALAWTGFQATWMLANWTSFKTLPVALGMPLFEVGAALLAIVLSRPAALLLAALYRKLHRLRFTPRRIAIVAAVVTAGAIAGGLLYVRHRLGGLEPALLLGPATVIAALAGVHAIDRLARSRRARAIAAAVAAIATAATAVAIVVAVRAPGSAPALVVATWGEHRTAGLAISHLYDLEAIRAHVPLADLAPAPQSPPSPHRDLVLVTVDALRADHTPAQAPRAGSPPRADMPALRELADRGYVFEWAFSTANTAPRALPAALIGVAANRIRDPRDPRHVVLAERFAAGGYDTAGFFDEPPPNVPLRGLAHVDRAPGSTALAVAQRAHRYLTARDAPGAKPLFLWVRFSGPREWQSAGELHTDDERQAAYDRTLAAVDAGITELLAAFAERGSDPARAPIFVIAGECGEGLGDHGQLLHGADLYDASTHVPLVVSGPSIARGRALEAVSLVDLVPTLLDLAGFAPPRGPDIDGASVADLATGRRASQPDGGIAFVELRKDATNPVPVTAVIKGAYKLIAFTNGNEVYNIHADPDEHFNLMAQSPRRIVDLRGHLEARELRTHTSPFTIR